MTRHLLALSSCLLLALSCGDEERPRPAGGFGGSSGSAGAGSGGSGGSSGSAGAPVCPRPDVAGSCGGGSSYLAFVPGDVDCAAACDHASAICAARACTANSVDLCSGIGASCVSDCEAGKASPGLSNLSFGCAALVTDCACWSSCVLAGCSNLP